MRVRTADDSDSRKEEVVVTLRALAGLSLACGCTYAMWIWMGLNAGSALWLWSAVSMGIIAFVMITVAGAMERRLAAEFEGRKPLMIMEKAA